MSNQKRFLVQQHNLKTDKKIVVGTFFTEESAQRLAKISEKSGFKFNVIYVERKYIR